MTSLQDEIFHSIQGIGFLGVAVLWIYDRLKGSERAESETTKLAKKMEDLDEKLTSAMTDMAKEVSSLAVSVGKLEGRMEARR